MKWQFSTGYGKRALVETAVGCVVLNRMTACTRLKSVRRQKATA